MKKRILIVEDDPSIRRLIEEELAFEGYETGSCGNGAEGLEVALEGDCDLIVLDLMLPDMSGLEICKGLRDRGFDKPIIMLTARGQEAEKVRGLDLGADDYLTKPFSLAEFVARVRALLRRDSRGSAAADLVLLGDISVNLRRRQVHRGDQEVGLTQKEFEILSLLIERRGDTISRDDFLDHAWQGTFVSHRTIDTHVASLRKKLEEDPQEPKLILSIRGMGYRLPEEPSAD